MNESSNPKGAPEVPAPRVKKPYAKPVLSHYGHVATLTQSASCAGSNDSATTLSCDPSVQRQMNSASDRRLKQEVVWVDSHPLGFGLYLFDYKPQYRAQWGHGRQFGVMADEVEKVVPQAVALHEDGYQVVDYALLGISRKLH
jgi:hypothetical protein